MSFSKTPSRSIQVVTSTPYTVSTEDYIVVATPGAATINLPLCGTRLNQKIRINVLTTGGSGATCTVNAATNDQIGAPFGSTGTVILPEGGVLEITPFDFSALAPPTPPATGHFWTLEELGGSLGYIPLWWNLATGANSAATGQVVEMDSSGPVWATP